MASNLSNLERAALDAILKEAIIEEELARLGREVDRTIVKRNAARKKKTAALQALMKAKQR